MSGDVKPGYKQTEVGVIPADWEVKSFESIAYIERGKFTARPRNDPKYYGGDIPFIQTGDVTNSSGEITAFSQTLNQAGLKVSKLFPQGTLFFTIAANIGDVGFAAFDTACPDSLVAITPNKQVNKRWLGHELRRRKKAFENLASHNAQLNLNLEKIRPYLLPIPSLTEQEAIAEALSDADALIESLTQLITKKRQIKQGAMQELLTGKRRLHGFANATSGYKQTEVGVIPEDWEVCKLGELSSLSSGTTPARNQYDRYYRKGSIHWVKTLDLNNSDVIDTDELVTDMAVEETSLHIFPISTVLVAMYGGFNQIGRTGLLQIPAAVNQAITAIRPQVDKLQPAYLLATLNFKVDYWKIVASSSRKDPNITSKDIRDFPIAYPRLPEQEAIAEALREMDAEITALETKLAKARQLKQGMMHNLLTGRIRLG